MILNLLRHYNRYVSSHPLLTLAMTSAGGMAVGNSLCQLIMNKKNGTEFNLKSVAQYAVFGFFISGPFMRYWWFALDLKIVTKPGYLKPVKMMLLDQAFTPFVLNAIFLYYLGFVNNSSHNECVDKVKEKLIPIAIESMKVWPAATLINFYIIPLNYRVLFSNSIAILWTSYFTYMVSQRKQHEQQQQEQE